MLIFSKASSATNKNSIKDKAIVFLLDISIAPIVPFLLLFILIPIAIVILLIYYLKHDLNKGFGIVGKLAIGYAVLAFVLTLAVVYLEGPHAPSLVTPADVMHEGLKTVQSKGFGITPAKKAVFEKGLLILKKSVLQADIPVSDAELAFNCKGTVCDDSKLKVATDSTGKGSSIESKSRIEAQIVVCGDDTKTPPAFKYCVGVGRDETDARTACVTKCAIS